ncbi:MAG: hypothetical protein MJZ67_03900 [Bacteroidales bacterium]|nr:hypothetical protein [Bacteroidales bacterium]
MKMDFCTPHSTQFWGTKSNNQIVGLKSSEVLNYSYTPKNKNFQFESIQIVADNPLCGAFDITFDENGVPTAHSQSGSSNTFTYNTTATSGTVYFPIMPGSYSSFDIIFSARQTKSNQLATYQVSFNNENNQTLDIVRGQKRVIGGTISWVQQ